MTQYFKEKKMYDAIETCKCKWCGIETTNTEDQQCDGCWELFHRIEWQPERAKQMIEAIEKAKAEDGGS